MKKTVIFSCPTLKRELETALAEAENKAEIIYLPGELHNVPKQLKCYLQEMIDKEQEADRIVICPSGCGGATCGLKATTAELVIPRSRDCLDLLLAARNAGKCKIDRPKHGIFYTDSWMQHTKASTLDLEKVEAKMGKEKGHEMLRKIYHGFEHFYVIDTGAYDVQPVLQYLSPLRQVLQGQVEVVPGEYGILWKIAHEQFDEDFWLIPQGSAMPEDAYKPDFDL